jgi:hypothetical protein
MSNLSTWENIALVVIMGGAVLLFFPGIKRALRASENTPKDWPSVIVPVLLVIAFVFLLIKLV